MILTTAGWQVAKRRGSSLLESQGGEGEDLLLLLDLARWFELLWQAIGNIFIGPCHQPLFGLGVSNSSTCPVGPWVPKYVPAKSEETPGILIFFSLIL